MNRYVPKHVDGRTHAPTGDLPMDPGATRGEHGTESTSLALSSADDVSDRRDSRGGARLPDMVRTRGDPQGSSQPLSTVCADFYNRRWKGRSGPHPQGAFL